MLSLKSNPTCIKFIRILLAQSYLVSILSMQGTLEGTTPLDSILTSKRTGEGHGESVMQEVDKGAEQIRPRGVQNQHTTLYSP